MTYRPNLPSPIASTTQPGVIKVDGTTITVAGDATASVVGTAITALTDISSGTLGGPAPSDVDALNRGGTDYKVTLSARAALFRKTPAGSRTITLASGGVGAVLTAADNDKQVVVLGSAGSITGDGTIADGFSCFLVNKTNGSLLYSGINGLGGATTLVAGAAGWVYFAASALEIAAMGGASSLVPATTTALGGVKPDGVSVATTTDGTLSVVTTTTHALPLGASISPVDEIATYSAASGSDVKYSLAQIGNLALSTIQSWTTASRPSLPASQFAFGFNTTLGRFEFWNGTAWNQHVRVSDMSASSAQLFGGTGTNGIAAPVSIGNGLQLSSGTLSSSSGVVPVTTIAASGISQALSFPPTGNRAIDVTLTSNCTFTVSGGSTGELQTLNVIIRGGAGGFVVTLPSNVKWRGGNAPAVDTSAGAVYLVRIQTSDGGATFFGAF